MFQEKGKSMKAVLSFFFVIWSVAMAQEVSIPYPHPRYDEDLIAKEIVNGTYLASIQMMIKNTKTGEERYVAVPDSPDIIDDAQASRELNAKDAREFDKEVETYDIDKIKELSVLPAKRKAGSTPPQIISGAMCPQGLDYVGETDLVFSYNSVGSHGLGFIDDSIISYKKTKDNGDPYEIKGNEFTFYSTYGTQTEALFTLKSDDYGYIHSIFSYGNELYYTALLDSDSKVHLLKLNLSTLAKTDLLVMDNDYARFLVEYNGELFIPCEDNDGVYVLNIHTGKKFHSGYKSNVNGYAFTAFARNVFHYDLAAFEIDDTGLHKIDGCIKKATGVSRFDYILSYTAPNRCNYNDRYGITHEYPRIENVTFFNYLGDVKEGYVAISKNDTLAYSKDFIHFTDTGVKVDVRGINYAYITHDYIYVGNIHVKVFKVNGWAYKAPRSDVAETMIKSGLKNGVGDIIATERR